MGDKTVTEKEKEEDKITEREVRQQPHLKKERQSTNCNSCEGQLQAHSLASTAQFTFISRYASSGMPTPSLLNRITLMATLRVSPRRLPRYTVP